MIEEDAAPLTKEELAELSFEEKSKLASRCVLRLLPLVGRQGNFDFWGENAGLYVGAIEIVIGGTFTPANLDDRISMSALATVKEATRTSSLPRIVFELCNAVYISARPTQNEITTLVLQLYGVYKSMNIEVEASLAARDDYDSLKEVRNSAFPESFSNRPLWKEGRRPKNWGKVLTSWMDALDSIGAIEIFNRYKVVLAGGGNSPIDQFQSQNIIKKWYTRHQNAPEKLSSKTTQTQVEPISKDGINYWWVNARPSIWKISDSEVGFEQTYECYSEKTGGWSKIKENYKAIQPGDLMVGYESGTTKKVVAVFKATKGVDENLPEKEQSVSFKILGFFLNPIPWDAITGRKELAGSKPVIHNQVSIHSLTREEFDVIYQMGGGIEKTVLKEEVKPASSFLHDAEKKIHSDRFAEVDDLEYEPFADAIFQLLNDREINPPPLTVALVAPWGHGKTTLMNFIKKKFEKRNGLSGQKNEKPESRKAVSTYNDVKKWLKNAGTFQTKTAINNPIIWFNPWEYQSSSQIYAGMAHAIIKQIADQLPLKEREEFWFSLHLSRIDTQALRRDLNRMLLSSSVFIVVLASILVFGGAFLALILTKPSWFYGGTTLAVLSYVGKIITNSNELRRTIDGKIGKYLKDPNYEKELGVYHHVNEDLSKVFNLLVGEPAVIFVDDLDRCSPTKVAEVIEAINLMTNSRVLGEKCYFILGMDAQMVAAALDEAYKEMKGKAGDTEKRLGSVGMYFLDKFIQLPFFIPVMDKKRKEHFLKKLLGKKEEGKVDDKQTVEENKAHEKVIEEAARQAVREGDDFDVAREIRRKNVMSEKDEAVFDKAFTSETLKQTEIDSDEILEPVREISEFLDPSPRSIKRFCNLLRFYSAQQKTRELKGDESASTSDIAKWLLIILKWPLLVRWVQWETEEKLISSVQPVDKARKLDELMQTIKKSKENDFEKLYKEWLEYLKKEEALHLDWLQDKELFHLLYEKHSDSSTLVRAILCRVW